jgi:hypothetical protein
MIVVTIRCGINQGLRICNTQVVHQLHINPINIMINTTNKMALKAAAKAEAMGWEVRIKLDQSDVVDLATVVAWAPGSTQVRYISFIEGHMSSKGWRDRNKIDGLLDYHLAL